MSTPPPPCPHTHNPKPTQLLTHLLEPKPKETRGYKRGKEKELSVSDEGGGFSSACDVREIHKIVHFHVARDNEFGFIDFYGGSEAR